MVNKIYIDLIYSIYWEKGGEEENMVYHCENREYLKKGIGSAGLWGHFFWFLGLIFAILGIIWDALDTTIGLTSMSWFLLAIVMTLLSIPMFIGWAISWYLKSSEK